MIYSAQEVIQFVEEEDVQFIRLAFCDVFGKQKNISIMPSELPRAFASGIAFDASAIAGFGSVVHSDLFLYPDPATLMILPWRPEHGRVVRMRCSIHRPDGTCFETDTRNILTRAVETAHKAGYTFQFGSEAEFYLFQCDEAGNPTQIPYDRAGYMDIAPEDRGENIRRSICLTLMQMGITPESSHHEEGPGQNEIDFHYSDPLTAAENLQTFRTVVQTVAKRNGVFADFSPKPLAGLPGSGLHINISVNGDGVDGINPMQAMIAGILAHIRDMTLFLNPTVESYLRFGENKAPKYVTWSHENRSQLVRIPAATGEYRRIELRSPDPLSNPYITYALLIYAALDGIQARLPLPEPANLNLYTADQDTLAQYGTLPLARSEAVELARRSAFIHAHLPQEIIAAYADMP